MLTLNGRNIFLGGFHDHWSRADAQNPSLLLAALNFYHYDFVCLMDSVESDSLVQRAAATYSRRLKVYRGREEAFGWGHVVTVTPRADALPTDDSDWQRTLTQLKKTCDLVILAHPAYPTTWEQIFKTGQIDRMLDEGLADGVELTIDADGPNAPRNAELIHWFQARDRAGKRTPIVGGWDIHMPVPVANLPAILYSADRPPDGHFEAPCNNRTLVFASRNTLEAICAAVRAGQTVLEDLRSGKLVGPADLVGFLRDAGYREAIQQMDAARDAVQLKSERPWTGGQIESITVSRAGTLEWPINFGETRKLPAKQDQPVATPAVPALLHRDQSYLPIAWHDDRSAVERIWAVQTAHPIQFDILPALRADGPALEFVPAAPFRGTLRVDLEHGYSPIDQLVDGPTIIPLRPRAKDVSLAVRFKAKAESESGAERSLTGFLSYIPVTRFNGNWSGVARYGVDRASLIPRLAYGASRPYPGAEVYSAQLQFAWDDEALYFRADVTDAVHYQPFSGHYAYNADCLQLAIDPLLRRRDTIGNFYSYNLALTKQGPELFRLLGPSAEGSREFAPPPRDISLGDQFLNVRPREGGLIYELRLPRSELAPVAPAAGTRMGVYYVMFNNNGDGHLDTLHWPVPIDGMWTVPNKWGVLTLVT